MSLLDQIKSKDLNKSLITEDNLKSLVELYPNEKLDLLADFLVSKNDDLEKTIHCLKKANKFQKICMPILKQDCISEINKGKLYTHGLDKEGRPLLIYRSRFHDKRDRDIEEMTKMIIWWYSYCMKLLPEDKHLFTLVFDRTNATANSADMDLFKFFVAQLANLYPNATKRVVVYPANIVFYSIWSIAKLFLKKESTENVVICVYFSGVQQYIEDKWIPISMGGQCTYEFNPDDYSDPYPEDVVAAELERRKTAEPVPKGTFFNIEIEKTD